MSPQQKRTAFYMLILLMITGMCLFHPHLAYAQVSGNGGGALFSSGTNFLSALQTLLTSTWARLTAIIGVIFLGFAWMFGRISMHLALSVIGGIILVFGAPAIVDGISGSL